MQYKCDNDYELLYLIKEEQLDYTSSLFDKYKELIRGLAYKYYSASKDRLSDYDDFYQEACIAFFNAIDSYEENNVYNARFNTFVTHCIIRRLISYTRKVTSEKSKGITFISYDDYDNFIIPVINDIKDVDIIDLFKKFIYDIPLKDSCIFELRYNGFSYKDISILLDITVRNVEYILKKCRERFSLFMKETI